MKCFKYHACILFIVWHYAMRVISNIVNSVSEIWVTLSDMITLWYILTTWFLGFDLPMPGNEQDTNVKKSHTVSPGAERNITIVFTRELAIYIGVPLRKDETNLELNTKHCANMDHEAPVVDLLCLPIRFTMHRSLMVYICTKNHKC